MVKKKVGNTFNPFIALPTLSSVDYWAMMGRDVEQVRQPPIGLLLLSMLLCLASALVSFVQGYPDDSLVWTIAMGVIGGSAIPMANAHKQVLADKKRGHFFNVVGSIVLVVIFAWRVYPTNPWLINACLATCLCMHVHAGQTIFRPVVPTGPDPSPKRLRSQAIIAAGLGLLFVAMSPTALGWLSIPALATVLCVHGWRLWFRFRWTALAQEQHIDIWPPALNDPRTSGPAWIALKRYIARETIDTRALRDVVARVNEPDALLAYFDKPPLGLLSPQAMTQFVQERLCERDPNASMVFSMEHDPRRAAAILVQLRAEKQPEAQSFALPDLDRDAHAT